MEHHNIRVSINNFLDEFEKNYDALYHGYADVTPDEFYNLVTFGDGFVKSHKEFVYEFVKFRGDFLSSDREIAAFAMTIVDAVDDTTERFGEIDIVDINR